RHVRPLLALAATLALLAGIVTPPGRAVFDSLRDAIGRERVVGVRKAKPALFSLPASGRVLSASRRGTWIVQANGSKRLLGRYRDPSWSPSGLFVAAIRGDELIALDPKGRVRWSVARPRLAAPSWTGNRRDARIAYLSGRTLRVIAGDGRGDRLIARAVGSVAPAWRPGPERHLAFVLRSGRLRVVDSESRRVLWSGTANPKSGQLEWSRDGRRLLVVDGRRLRLYTERGRVVRSLRMPRGRFVLDADFRPGSHDFAYSTVHPPTHRGRILAVTGRTARQAFAGTGWFGDLSWSPDGRWLGFSWREANQWVFLRLRGDRVGKIAAVSNIASQLGRDPYLAGWCCAP
ncbi:MAG: PD40 domain-containing protein, partial [Actinobacteria bacterium]|nr:PD40 domain-containing protein [Actinomycetota bacterium]